MLDGGINRDDVSQSDHQNLRHIRTQQNPGFKGLDRERRC